MALCPAGPGEVRFTLTQAAVDNTKAALVPMQPSMGAAGKGELATPVGSPFVRVIWGKRGQTWVGSGYVCECKDV